MFYSVDGRIIQVDGRFPIFQDNTFSFNVDGVSFPKPQNPDNKTGSFSLGFSEPNFIEINWGDGTIENLQTTTSTGFYGDYEIGLSHTYQDTFTGFRTISFKIEKPLTLIRFDSLLAFLGPVFPTNIRRFINLKRINLEQRTGIENFPENLTPLTKLNRFLINGGSLSQLPISILGLPLEIFSVRQSVDLSRPFSETNLDKINLLQNTLKDLTLSRNGITELPETLGELTLLERLDLQGTPISSFPVSLPNLINIFFLRIDGTKIQIMPPEVYNLPSLVTLDWNLRGGDNMLQSFQNFDKFSPTIETLNFRGSFGGQVFDCTIPDMSAQINLKYFRADGRTTDFQIEVDKIVNGWYDIVNQNASKTGGNTKFRQMTFLIASRDGLVSPTGTYQQPAGFVLGSDNGTPASPKEKIWVMVNQYEHTWNYTE